MIALSAATSCWYDAFDTLETEARAAGIGLDMQLQSVGVRGAKWHHTFSCLDSYKLALEKTLADVRGMSKPVRRGGVSNARRVPCTKSAHHGHHPEGERCGYCE